MTSLADRALRARKAADEAAELERKAAHVRRRQIAARELGRFAERVFDIDIDPDDIEGDRSGARSFSIVEKVNDDLDLALRVHFPHRDDDSPDDPVASVKVCDQLYWDLEPGVEKKPLTGGGTYGCYGLGTPWAVESLDDLGGWVERVAEARARWRSKHCEFAS